MQKYKQVYNSIIIINTIHKLENVFEHVYMYILHITI